MQLPASPPPVNRPADLWRGHRRYWLAQIGAWGAGALIGIGQFIARPEKDMTLAEAVFITTASAVLCIVVTHILRVWIKRSGLTHRPWARALWPALVAVSVATLGLICIVFLLALTRGKWRTEMWLQDPVNEFAGDYLSFFILILGWFVVYCAVQYQRQFHAVTTERIQLDAALQGAELRALRGQLNPHFLFNALNVLRRLVDSDPARARHAITRLAALLRATLSRSELATVELAVELEQVNAYLELEVLRFEERLQVTREIDESLLATPVPPFVLLLLVENAVKHGITNRLEGGCLGISIRREEKDLVLRVTNPGPIAVRRETGGVGLRNLQERLRLLYRDRASFALRCESDNLVTATVRLPLAGSVIPSPPTAASAPPS